MSGRTLAEDWHPGTIPDNVAVHETAYLETSFSFLLYRSRAAKGVTIERGASVYKGTMFNVGPGGRVRVGAFALVHAARIDCEERVEIGDHALISWNVVLMDTYGIGDLASTERRRLLERLSATPERRLDGRAPTRPVRIGRNVWLGFDVCVLPGVTVGEGSIVGARSVVADDVPPFCVVAGNPARVIRRLDPPFDLPDAG
jgi:acetyltransferase-like isoleucine patch superfamily enzyme